MLIPILAVLHVFHFPPSWFGETRRFLSDNTFYSDAIDFLLALPSPRAPHDVYAR
jgi:hypothetical protein